MSKKDEKTPFRPYYISSFSELAEFIHNQQNKLPKKFVENTPEKYITVEGIENQAENLRRLKQQGPIRFYVVNQWEKYQSKTYSCTMYGVQYDPELDDLTIEKTVSSNL